jgi:hypothetical protein
MPDWGLPDYPTEPEKDIVQDFEYLKEYAEQHYPKVPYRINETPIEDLDDVHTEIALRYRTFSEPVILRGFVTQAGKHDQPTTKGAIDWEREIILHVPVYVLEDLGWVTLGPDSDTLHVNLGMGDIFRFHEYDFEVLNAQRSDERYHNTDIPMYWDMTAKRLRPDSAEVIDWDMDPEE